MNCVNCEKKMTSTRENYRYIESGLPNVVLVNLEVRRCAECGETELVIPKLAQLHRVLARAVSEQAERLSAEEIKFLRKYLGWSGADFAGSFGVTKETVSRWENGAKQMGQPAERLLRVCALALEPIQDYSILRSIAVGEPAHRDFRFALTDHWAATAA